MTENAEPKKRKRRNWRSDDGIKPLLLSPYFITNASQSHPHTIGREAQVKAQVLPRGYYYAINTPPLHRISKPNKRLVVLSPYFHNNEEERRMVSVSPRRGRESDRFNKFIDAYTRKREDNDWIPPQSAHGLLQEKYCQDPWKVLVICMLLNKTRGVQLQFICVSKHHANPEQVYMLDKINQAKHNLVTTISVSQS